MLIWTSRNIPNVGLFSAYAEVFPRRYQPESSERTFLCLRRGVSTVEVASISGLQLFSAYAEVFPAGVDRAGICYDFSLPTQRCFLKDFLAYPVRYLFSAYAEVFLEFSLIVLNRLPFLCLRRGVSSVDLRALGNATFSLPTQRCFRTGLSPSRQVGLFSAYAEVFPGRDDRGQRGETFLCLRRGVSMPADYMRF